MQFATTAAWIFAGGGCDNKIRPPPHSPKPHQKSKKLYKSKNKKTKDLKTQTFPSNLCFPCLGDDCKKNAKDTRTHSAPFWMNFWSRSPVFCSKIVFQPAFFFSRKNSAYNMMEFSFQFSWCRLLGGGPVVAHSNPSCWSHFLRLLTFFTSGS